MKSIPSITSQINEKKIHLITKKYFSKIAPFWYLLFSNWLIRAYKNYNDIDKFLIIIYLINKNFIFYRKNGLIIDYDTFYKDKILEIEKINISDISKDLKIPKESVRRKILELVKINIIKKTGKKIFDNRTGVYATQSLNTLKDMANLLQEFSKLLKKEKIGKKIYQTSEISYSIKKNFSFCWYQFYKFLFILTNRLRAEFKDLETCSIGFVVVISASHNKNFRSKELSLKSYGKLIMGSDEIGVNAMSISEITGIPRPTVVRKLKYLIENNFLSINKKKLISLNIRENSEKRTTKLRNKNMLSLSNFIFRIFNQIKIINSN